MAEANEKLRKQMEEAPAGSFDIEQVDEAQRLIEMVSGAALVHLVMGRLISPVSPALSGCGAGGAQRLRK